jgi:integrase
MKPTKPTRIPGSIFFRTQRGKWYYQPPMVDGRRQAPKNLGTADEAEAQVALAALLKSGLLVKPTAGFAGEIEDYLDDRAQKGKHRSATTLTRTSVLTQFAKWATEHTPNTFGEAQAAAYYKWLRAPEKKGGRGLKATTANSYMAQIGAFFEWLKKAKKLRGTNPFTAVERDRVEDGGARCYFVPYADTLKIIAEAPTDDLKFIYYCGFQCGMRKNEIVEAQPGWFDLRLKTCHIQDHSTFRRKNGKILPIPLSDEFVAFLKTYLNPHAPYCLRPDTTAARTVRYRYDFRVEFLADIRRHDPKATAHTMRHSFASHMAQVGTSLHQIAVWIGDKVATVEKHYAHLLPDHSAMARAREQLAKLA